MTSADNESDVSQLKNELDEALSALDLALLEAGRSVSTVRNNMTRVFALAEHAGEMETAIVRAREQLALTLQGDSAATPLRAVPAQDDTDVEEQVSDAEPVQEPENEPTAEIIEKPDTEPESEPVLEPASTATRCLRLKVSKKSGSLDLKDVDGSVNENSSVMDVALLDYDGRQATLKLWVNERADPNGVREALLTSLRTHLGEEDTEVDIEFEEDSAA